MKELPLIYHPTNLYWVDDDSLFLEIVVDRYKEHYGIKTSSGPNDALNYFKSYESYFEKSDFLRGYNEVESYDLANHLPVNLDFNSLRKWYEYTNRHDEIAVIIVDYRMPVMDGIELCRKLSHVPAKKILLTGEADLQEAVIAFNDGIIDCFIRKDDPIVDVSLATHINKLSVEYFIKQTRPIFHHIEADFKLPHSDPIFVNFINEFVERRGYLEYYLADKNGGLMLRNGKSEGAYLVVHTARTLNDFVELHSDNIEAEVFLKKIREKSKIPFFGVGEEIWGSDIMHWEKCFYTPQVLNGRDTYYWALVSL